MSDAIVVEGLSKQDRAHHRAAGLAQSLRALFWREYRTVRAAVAALLAAVGSFARSAWFWRFALRCYTGASA